jgi:hypothetical protein
MSRELDQINQYYKEMGMGKGNSTVKTERIVGR